MIDTIDFQTIAPPKPDTADEEFEKLRQRFHERLKQEQTQLATLSDALGSATAAAAATLVDIGEFSHRLRGAALVFGFQGLAADAKAVELAVSGASLDANTQCDPSVMSTMRALAAGLADEIGRSSSW